MSEDNDKSPISVVVGIWTGFAIWIVIMTAFRWWYVWWAYFPLIGILSGAIQQTADFLHNQKTQDQGKSPIQSDPEINEINGSLDSETINMKFCSNCGSRIPIDASVCPNCGANP